MRSPPRVLLVRFSSLGDVVLATAAAEALARDLPGAVVHVLTKPPFQALFENHPGVQAVVPWDPAEGLRTLARRLGAGGYDWVVDLHGNLRTRLLRALVRGPRWSRYAKGVVGRRLAVLLGRPGGLPADHVVDRYLGALAPLGVRAGRVLPKLYPREEERAEAAALLPRVAGTPPWVALAPGARWATKAWPARHWAEVAARLVTRGLGVPVVVGGPEDARLGAEVLARTGGQGLNACGRTSVRATAALLERVAVLVTNDSAPLHLATAVGTPVIALFGPTVQGFGFHPLGPEDAVVEVPLDCRPCSLHGSERCPKGHHRCMEDIAEARVLEAVTAVTRAEPPCGGPAAGESERKPDG